MRCAYPAYTLAIDRRPDKRSASGNPRQSAIMRA